MGNQSIQSSIIAYVQQPYHAESSSCGTIDAGDWDSVENEEGLFDPRLSNFTTLQVEDKPIGTAAEFTINFDTDDARLDLLKNLSDPGQLTIALIGCTLKSYLDDGGGNPDFSTEREEIIQYTIETSGLTGAGKTNSVEGLAYNSQNNVTTFCKNPLPGIVSGGTANIVFTGHSIEIMPGSGASITIGVHVHPTLGGGRNNAFYRLSIGHLFVGQELPIQLNPDSFTWNMESLKERFKARDNSAISSDAVLVRSASCEVINISFFDIAATQIASFGAGAIAQLYPVANFFDLIKTNASYPALFIPYPTDPLTGLDPGDGDDQQKLYLSARQNFFSIYGFLESRLELRLDEFRDGLNSDYKARFRITETR